MYSFEVTQNIARALAIHLLSRKKNKKLKKSNPVINNSNTNSDFIDYDGMGNYGRFPCSKK